MALTPQEEALHLEVKLLIMFNPKTDEEQYIYKNAMYQFFETHQQFILNTIDKHLDAKAKYTH